MFKQRSRGKRIAHYIQVACVAAVASAATLFVTYEEPVPVVGNNYGTMVEADPAPVGKAGVKVDKVTNCELSSVGTAPVLAKGKPMDAQWEAAVRRIAELSGLPAPAHDELIAKLRSGKSDNTMSMGSTHGRLTVGEQLFYPLHINSFRVGDRYGVCLNTLMRFNNPHRTEEAQVFVIVYGGVTYWYGKMIGCNNPVRFWPAPFGWIPPVAERDVVAPPPSGVVEPPPIGYLPPAPPPDQFVQPPGYNNPYMPPPGYAPPAPNRVNEVPEPGTIALVLLAVVAIVYTRRRR